MNSVKVQSEINQKLIFIMRDFRLPQWYIWEPHIPEMLRTFGW